MADGDEVRSRAALRPCLHCTVLERTENAVLHATLRLAA